MLKFNTACQVNSSDTKVLEHLCNLDQRASARLVTVIAQVEGSRYLGSVNVAILHHGEDATQKALEKGYTVLQLDIPVLQPLKFFIVTLEAIVVSDIGVAQTFKCQL